MEIKQEEWADFAKFIAGQSTHQISQWLEDGTYTVCPFSTMERAYQAFLIMKQTGSYSEVRKFYDVDVESQNPQYPEWDDPSLDYDDNEDYDIDDFATEEDFPPEETYRGLMDSEEDTDFTPEEIQGMEEADKLWRSIENK
jgi:hypothetical protein